MHRKSRHHRRPKHHGRRFGRDPSKKGKKIPAGLRIYHSFMQSHQAAGMTHKQAHKAWKSRKRSHVGKKRKGVRKHKGISNRALPQELLDLAKALRSASKTPTSKDSAIFKKLKDAARSIRKAQDQAAAAARAAHEEQQIVDQARSWYSGDPDRELPAELAALAKALESFRAKPTGDKKSSIQRKLENAARSIRKAQDKAAKAAREAHEEQQIVDQARSWYSGDPGRKGKKGKKGKGKKHAKKSGKGKKSKKGKKHSTSGLRRYQAFLKSHMRKHGGTRKAAHKAWKKAKKSRHPR